MDLNQDSIIPQQSFDENANVIKNDDLEAGAKSLLEQLTGTKNLDVDTGDFNADSETLTHEIPTQEIVPDCQAAKQGLKTSMEKNWQVLFEKDDGLQELQEEEIQIEALSSASKSNEGVHDNVHNSVVKKCHKLDADVANEGTAAIYLSEVEANLRSEVEAATNRSDQVFIAEPEPSENDSAVLTFGGEVLDISDTPFENTSPVKDGNDEDQDQDQPKVIITSTSPKKKSSLKVRLNMKNNQNSWRNNYNNDVGRGRGLQSRKPNVVPPPPGFDSQRQQRPRQFNFNQYNMNQSNYQENNGGYLRQQHFFRYNVKSGYNQNLQSQRPGYTQNHNNGQKTPLALQLAGAAKSIEQQFFFNKSPMNRHNQYGNNNQTQSYRNYNQNQNSRGQISNRIRMNPIYDYLNEIMEEVETEAPGRIVNLLVGLKPSAARKLCISNFGNSYYELRMRLPVSTPISVVKRIFLAKFHMTMLIRVSIYSTDRNSEFYQAQSCLVMENDNREVTMVNALDMNAFSMVTRKDGRFVSEAQTIYDILYRQPDLQDKTIYGGEIGLLLT